MKTKRSYNLPHNITYSIVGSFYTGGIEGEGYDICANCNMHISRIAVIKDENNKKFHVGFDCAATLSGIKDTDCSSQLELFKLGTSIRTSILNALKRSSISHVYNTELTNVIHISLDSDNHFRNSVHKSIANNELAHSHILPQLTDLYGWYIKKTKVEESFIQELISMIEVGMELTPNSYHRIVSEITDDLIICDDLYMYNGSKSKYKKVQLLGELIYADNNINKLLKERGLFK